MAGPKSRLEATRFVQQIKMYIFEAEIAEENNRATSFGEKACLFADTFTYVSNKQNKPQINNCCQEVMQNNVMTFPWSNHCWMLVASRKTTTR